jgi:hypothetical protein
MKGTPRSLWLSMAHQMTGWWMSTAITAIERQQRAMLSETLKLATGKKPKRSPRASARKGKVQRASSR